MQKFVYKAGSRFPAPAQAVGERLEAITARAGSITPRDVVEDARDPGSPLHPLITWDDAVAAEEHRLAQARRILRSVYPVHVDAEGRERPVLGWINATVPDEGRVYVTTVRAVTDEELRGQVLEEAMDAMRSLQARYQHIAELEDVFHAMNLALRRVRRNARQPRQAAEA